MRARLRGPWDAPAFSSMRSRSRWAAAAATSETFCASWRAIRTAWNSRCSRPRGSSARTSAGASRSPRRACPAGPPRCGGSRASDMRSSSCRRERDPSTCSTAWAISRRQSLGHRPSWRFATSTSTTGASTTTRARGRSTAWCDSACADAAGSSARPALRRSRSAAVSISPEEIAVVPRHRSRELLAGDRPGPGPRYAFLPAAIERQKNLGVAIEALAPARPGLELWIAGSDHTDPAMP
jgi:hypothetical protein